MSQDNQVPKSRNLPILGIILAVIGVAISVYALNHHLAVKADGATEAFCNINQTFSCDDVAKSKYAEDPWGNPLGIYGIGYFAGLVLLLGTAAFKSEYYRDNMQTYAVSVIVGAIGSVALFLISYFEVGSLCLSCMGVYAVTLIQLLVAFFLRSEIPGSYTLKNLYNGGSYILIALAASIGLFQIAAPMPADNDNFTADNPRSEEEMRMMIEAMKPQEIKIDRSAYSGLGEDYRKGSDDAKVTIVKFADYQCGACGDAAKTLSQIHRDFGDAVQIVYKNFPLDNSCNRSVSGPMHPAACDAAILSRCAGQYGKFWPMHDILYANQSKIDKDRNKLWALELGLSSEQIDECRSSNDILAKIKADIDQAIALNVQSTPTMYMNGVKINARSYPALKRQIEIVLGQ